MTDMDKFIWMIGILLAIGHSVVQVLLVIAIFAIQRNTRRTAEALEYLVDAHEDARTGAQPAASRRASRRAADWPGIVE